jgi:hypothetical protein
VPLAGRRPNIQRLHSQRIRPDNGARPLSPAADRQSIARNAGRFTLATCAPARSWRASAIRTIPSLGSGIADSTRAVAPANAPPARRRPSTMPAPNLKPHAGCSSQTGPRRTFRCGAIKNLGPLRSIAASIGASACRRIGDRNRPPVVERGWKAPGVDAAGFLILDAAGQWRAVRQAGGYIPEVIS